MKLTLDCVITPHVAELPQADALVYLLSMGHKAWQHQPLEEHVCHAFGLTPQLDYPLAAVAASADGLDVGADYWLRADPVHLLMQRDSFSLAEPVPLPLAASHTQALLSSLNAHFQPEQNMTFVQGKSGACYLRLSQNPQIKTSVPSVAVGKNMFHYMPQGESSAQWRAYLNEAQMLLHTHPVNALRESAGLPAINSLWLSGGGVLPPKMPYAGDVNIVVADSAFYSGLAQWAGVSFHNAPVSMEDALRDNPHGSHMRVQCSPERLMDGGYIQVLVNAIKANKIKRLVMNVGYYERTLLVTVSRLDLLKFWRKVKPLSDIFS